MTYKLFLSALIVIFIALQAYFIGKYSSKRYELFKTNSGANFVLGFIIYFLVSLVVFFPFIWLKLSILYFIVIFFIKDGFQILFLFARRDVFKKEDFKKKDLFHIMFSIVSMIGISLSFNMGFEKIIHMKSGVQTNNFQSWFLFKEIISEFSNLEMKDVLRLITTPLAALLMFNVVSSFIYAFTRKDRFIDMVIALFMTVGLILLFNFGYRVESIIGVFLLLFAVQIGIKIIQTSRRRYSLIFGLIIVVLWFFNPNLILAEVSLAFAISMLYTFLKKRKPSIFAVQLIVPTFMMSTLFLYPISSIGATILLVLSFMTYAFIIYSGRIERMEKLNDVIIRTRIIWPSLLLFILLLAGSILILQSSSFTYKDLGKPLVYSFNNLTFKTVQYYVYFLFILIIIPTSVYIVVKKKTTGYKIGILLSALVLTFSYTPFLKQIISSTFLKDGFDYLMVLSVAPVLLSIPILIRKSS
ncbi:MAG: hypothetical protein KAG91_02050 [Mycoplasmataceae bacterium]|nr:hypothetical protein [Mycoplasmataceae bacterium]